MMTGIYSFTGRLRLFVYSLFKLYEKRISGLAAEERKLLDDSPVTHVLYVVKRH